MAYEPHPHCLTPPDDTVVWRFVDLAKLLDLLENGQLWFSRADLLEDPREGRLTDSERRQVRITHEDPEDQIRRYESIRQDFYVNCWYAGETESMAMWKLFHNGGYAFAIRSTIGAIKKTLTHEEGPVFAGRIQYLDWAESSSLPNNAIGMMVRKSRSYGHESEVRLVIWAALWRLPSIRVEVETEQRNTTPSSSAIDIARVANDMADALRAASPTLEVPSDQYRRICGDAILKSVQRAEFEAKPTGMPVRIDSKSLVTELIVGPDVPNWVFELVKSLSLRYGLVAPISWSSLKSVEKHR